MADNLGSGNRAIGANEAHGLSILTLEDDNGRQLDYYVIARFGYNSRDYIALTPVEGGNGGVELYRSRGGNGNSVEISVIPGEVELNAVAEEYQRIAKTLASLPLAATITLIDESGGAVECLVLQTFRCDGQDVIALMPSESEGDVNIQLFYYAAEDVGGGRSNITLFDIPGAAYANAAEEFARLMAEDGS
jgi:uncharacterized protein YrzB (UPF0473 family)